MLVGWSCAADLPGQRWFERSELECVVVFWEVDVPRHG